MTRPKRAAIYARYSDARLQTARSIEDQVRMCRELAAREGYEIVGVYADAGVRAGAKASKLEYERLLKDAKAGAFDVVMVDEVSRLSRDQDDVVELRAFHKAGVLVHSALQGPIRQASATDKFMTQVHLYAAEVEGEQRAGRVRRGQEGKFIDGYSAGGTGGYGYRGRRIRDATQLDIYGEPKYIGVQFEIDPECAAIVVRIFTQYDSGRSPKQIAEGLNEDRVPSPKAKRWNPGTVTSLLDNERYRGLRYWGRSKRSGEKNPKTGKKTQLTNEDTSMIRQRTDDRLRIIDEELWGPCESSA